MVCEVGMAFSSWKILSIESRNGMAVIVRKRFECDLEGMPRKEVYQILTRKLEHLEEVLKESS